MAQQGVMEMDADIRTYLEPDFPAFERPVTMRMLLTHSAGFEDMVTGIAVPNVSDTMPLNDSVRRYRPAQSLAPGVTSYSNYGIALAAYAIERAAGRDFAQLCREEIFLPLGMEHTTFEHMHDVAYVAKPYRPDGRETLEPFMNLYPEGSAVSTAGDMARYMLWLADPADERVLSAGSKAALFARQFAMADGLPGMGYAWNRKEQNGYTYSDKKGETLNFYSRIALFPEKKAGVFLSVNAFLAEERLDGVMRAAADAELGEPVYGQGQSSFDIAGVYADNNSSLTTMEKVIRYLIPEKMFSVEGSMKNGYAIGGQSLTPVGEDEYASPMGVLKFLQKRAGAGRHPVRDQLFEGARLAGAGRAQAAVPALYLFDPPRARLRVGCAAQGPGQKGRTPDREPRAGRRAPHRAGRCSPPGHHFLPASGPCRDGSHTGLGRCRRRDLRRVPRLDFARRPADRRRVLGAFRSFPDCADGLAAHPDLGCCRKDRTGLKDDRLFE
jgi:hypothetical protein